MAEHDKMDSKIHKVLFLGPGGSGKSTIFKQLQWLHGGGFTEQDAFPNNMVPKYALDLH